MISSPSHSPHDPNNSDEKRKGNDNLWLKVKTFPFIMKILMTKMNIFKIEVVRTGIPVLVHRF